MGIFTERSQKKSSATSSTAAIQAFSGKGEGLMPIPSLRNKESSVEIPNALRFLDRDDASSPRKSASRNQSSSVECVAYPPREAVAFRAWQIWRSEGCPNNRALANWIQAEKELSR